MKKWPVPSSVWLLLAISLCEVHADEEMILDHYPHVVLSNGIIETSVFLPDAREGFYRSSRFEWSGMIWQLTYKNHTYFTLRTQPHDPESAGHGTSLAEEFSIGTSREIPQRYTEAKPGETFMKIGVGNLEKSAGAKSYNFSTPYKIVDSGTWKTSHGKNWVAFTHNLQDEYGYGYHYVKRMELPEGNAQLVISHELKNTGAITILADQYNHNFFSIDHEPIDKGYRVELFFPGSTRSNLAPTATMQDNTIILQQRVEKALFGVFKGFDDSLSHNHVIIRNTNTGAGVDISGDFPLSGFNFYADSVVICPELFILLNVEPGETVTWKRFYTFFAD